MRSIPAGASPRTPVFLPAPEVAIRESLASANTVREVAEATRAEIRAITGRTEVTVNFQGSDVVTAREHAEGILRGLERFPDAKVSVWHYNDKGIFNAYAQTRGWVIDFNTAYARAAGREKYLEALRYDSATGWHPVGTASPTGTALHEFGHALAFGVDHAALSARIETVLREAAERTGVAVEDRIKQEISGYANSAEHELVAEAFVDVMINGDAASGLSREIFDALEAEYREKGFTVGQGGMGLSVPAPVDPLARKTVVELRAEAKARGLTGYSKLTKPQLLERLRAAEPVDAKAAERALIAEANKTANVATEVHELVANQASTKVLAHRLDVLGKQLGVDTTRLATLADDPQALLRTVDEMADRAGLTRVGTMGERTQFDRALHEGVGNTTPDAGSLVTPVRPGYSLRLPSGEQVKLSRAVMRELNPTEVRQLQRETARAAARERNRILETRTKVGDLLAEFDELLAKGADKRLFEERLAYAASTSSVDEATLTALRKAVAADDQAKLRSAMTRVAKKNEIKPVGKAGQTAKYDPAAHEPLGAVPAEGAPVRVVTRGTSTVIDGQEIQLTRAKVVNAGPTHEEAEAAGRAMLRGTLNMPSATEMRKAGLVRVGAKTDPPTAFDPALHQTRSGIVPPPGAQVKVIKPGFAIVHDGETIVLERPVVKVTEWPDRGPLPNRGAPTVGSLMVDSPITSTAARFDFYAEQTEKVASAIDGPYGALVVRTKDVTTAETHMAIVADVLDAAGKKVGSIQRFVERDPDGNMTVEHVLLKLNRNVQGSGFAEKFNNNLYDWYRRSGLAEVKVHADIDVGGYTWATQGFDFANARQAEGFVYRSIAKMDQVRASGKIPKGLTAGQFDDLYQYLVDLRAGKIPASAPDIARFGRQPGQGGRTAIWPGKWLMLGSDWHGVLPL